MTEPNPSWVSGLRRGDPAAFDAVFDAYQPALWRFLVHLCGQPEVAEELLQDTFLRLARHARRLHPDSNLRAWLFTVAGNLWRSHRRWRWLDRERLAEWFSEAAPAAPTGPDTLAESRRTLDEIEQELHGLSPTLREVALLVLVEGWTPTEAAAILGASPEAVRQRVARARRAISTAIERGRP
jgi:RNA polymerase sigma factor (sigma-70 family)